MVRFNTEEEEEDNDEAEDEEVEIEEEYQKKNEKADQKSTLVEPEKTTIFSKYDTLFFDIQNQLEGKSCKSNNFIGSARPNSWTAEEITHAKTILKQCLDIDLDNVIQLGRDFELKKLLSILLNSNAFPENTVDEMTTFIANFVQSCEQYEVAKKDLREVQEKEKTIEDLKTDMKQLLSSDFLPIRTQGEVVDHEIAELERQLTERKAKKARLSKMLEDLAGRAATSKQTLDNAEQDHEKSCVPKKEQAEKVIGDMKRSWDSLKLNYSNMLL
ncbi:uncharacterized protein LOC133793861 [Humulus lupulus]|uniref:uncharacterized protein LOC133793861 n=1 Tax=Humulus lupulus TaxID=3486 RepID=UPI002B403869|nr:uncharacterized protein LOC133793861 [Humulus lupulus]